MPRLLHTADWQIGRQFTSFDPEVAPLLAEARLGAVERIAQLAADHAVDAVLVAGDVFDAQTVSDRTLRRLFNALAAYDGPWLMIPGNHDAALAESVWTRARRLQAVPANVHLLLEPAVHLEPARGFAVLPAPLTQRHTYGDLTEWFDAAATPDGLLRIGLAHGSVQGLLAEGIDSPNPIALDRCTRARLDYLALGDWHGLRQIEARMAYSGTPEPDRFRNNDAGRALLVDVPGVGAEPVLTPLTTGRFRWQSLAARLQVGSDVDELIGQLASLGADDVVDLQVSGQTDLADRQRLVQALGLTEARVRHLQTDLAELHLRPTAEDVARLQVDGYLGEVIAELGELAGSDHQPAAERERASDALALLAAELMRRTPDGASA